MLYTLATWTAVIIGAPVLFLLLVVAARLLFFWLRYRRLRTAFAHVPPLRGLGAIPMLSLFEAGSLEAMVQATLDADGNMKPVLFGGAHLDGVPWLLFADVGDIKQLLQDSVFPKLPLIYDGFRALVGNGLVTSSGELWKRQRRLITPIFHFSNLSCMTPIMVRQVDRWVAEMRQLDDKTVSPFEHFSTLTLRVVIECAFGRDSLDDAKMARLWHDAIESISSVILFNSLLSPAIAQWLPLPFNFTLRRTMAELSQMVQQLIDKRRHEVELLHQQQDEQALEASGDALPNDLLTSLLKARDPATGEGMPNELLIDESLTFLAAGHDTTSNLLSWCMYFLGRDPNREHVLAMLRAEVVQVLADDEYTDDVSSSSSGRAVKLRAATHDDIPRLAYCRQVLCETLRLRPPAGLVDRVASNDCVLAGVAVPKGTYVYPWFQAAQVDKRYWSNPFEFRPERFAADAGIDSDAQPTRNAYAFLPFSAGPRNCVGQKFALLEATVVLAYLVHHFDIECDPNQVVQMKFVGTATPYGFTCAFKPRFASDTA